MAGSSAARAPSRDPQSRRRQRSPPAARAAEDTDCPLERPREQRGLSRPEQAEWGVAGGATWPISREADRLKATPRSPNSPTVSDRLAAKPNLSGNALLDNGKADDMIVGRQNGRGRQA